MSQRFLVGVAVGVTVTSAVLGALLLLVAPPEPTAALGSVAPGSTTLVPPASDCAPLLEERARLERELADLKQRRLRAQAETRRHELALEDLGEVPLPWPDDVPDVLRPERFEEELWRRVEGLADVQVEAVDCSEYPCIGILRVDGGGDDWFHPTSNATEAFAREVYGEGFSIWGTTESTHRRGEPVREPQIGLQAFALFPSDGDEAVSERLSARSRLLHAELQDRLGDALEAAAEPRAHRPRTRSP